jgi:hypothetical protein
MYKYKFPQVLRSYEATCDFRYVISDVHSKFSKVQWAWNIARRTTLVIKRVYIGYTLGYNIYILKKVSQVKLITTLINVTFVAMGIAAIIVFHVVRLIVAIGLIIIFRLKLK